MNIFALLSLILIHHPTLFSSFALFSSSTIPFLLFFRLGYYYYYYFHLSRETKVRERWQWLLCCRSHGETPWSYPSLCFFSFISLQFKKEEKKNVWERRWLEKKGRKEGKFKERKRERKGVLGLGFWMDVGLRKKRAVLFFYI